LVLLGFELRAFHLLSRCSATGTTLLAENGTLGKSGTWTQATESPVRWEGAGMGFCDGEVSLL
jgi:hypothetical protein